ncbi:hypothetical protein [Pseudoalteromonas sp.]|uniref:hypothetical protein n=1 Tax=Pseudoalteromonas sp. TaxID=53249 RepID=UPI003F9B1A4E
MLLLQGCTDSKQVVGVVQGSVNADFQSDLFRVDLIIEDMNDTCTILLSLAGQDLYNPTNEKELLKGVTCLRNDGVLLAGVPQVESFTWSPVEGGVEFTIDATAQSNDYDNLNITTNSPLFIKYRK